MCRNDNRLHNNDRTSIKDTRLEASFLSSWCPRIGSAKVVLTNTANKIDFSCHMETCAAMNTANLLLHQWIITTYPDIVDIDEAKDEIYAICYVGRVECV